VPGFANGGAYSFVSLSMERSELAALLMRPWMRMGGSNAFSMISHSFELWLYG
jgi:hypothetical protein